MRIIELLTRASRPSFAELHSTHYPHYIANLPLPIANATAASPHQLLVIFALVVAQTLCLYLIYRTFTDQSPHASAKVSLALSVVAMIFVSLQAKFTSADIYAYIGYAKLGLSAYAPPDRPFAGDFAIINAQWGNPMLPCVYGPFWVVMSKLAIMGSSTLGQAILALRIFNLATLGLLILCVASIRKDYAVTGFVCDQSSHLLFVRHYGSQRSVCGAPRGCCDGGDRPQAGPRSGAGSGLGFGKDQFSFYQRVGLCI